MGKVATFLSVLALGIAPRALIAQETIRGILGIFVDILSTLIPAIMVLALLAFIWGAIKLIYIAGDEKDRAGGKQTMIWGTLALFFMVTVWGLVQIIKVTFFGDI